MLKSWAALPRGTRWLLGGSAVVVVALVAAWALFVPTADWLAHHDVGSVTGPLHETALDNARGRLLTLGAGLFAAGALWFTARSFTLSREGQVTDRYTKAIDQLGSKELDVRIGGIYALERVARDSRRDHPTVMEVLAAFIREHSREQWPAPGPTTDARPTQTPEPDALPTRTTRPDVQAAITVIGRRIPRNDRERINLTRANLAGADLTDADLTRATLGGAHLADAYLGGSYLRGAILHAAKLRGAYLVSADLGGAILAAADLAGADLTGVDLGGAWLTGADLTDADLTRATLGGAHLAGADLTGARWPEDTPVPEGWKRDSGSGRLERSVPDLKPPESN